MKGRQGHQRGYLGGTGYRGHSRESEWGAGRFGAHTPEEEADKGLEREGSCSSMEK